MKLLLTAGLVLCTVISSCGFEDRAGFFLPDDVAEITFRFKTVQNLVVLPVVINDSIRVNLIVDTGCRNLVLFGKKFQKLLVTQPGKTVQFAGLGDGDPVRGKLSLNNKVSIQGVLGEQIPVVVVAQQNLFSAYKNIHGVIGYDILIKFEIEINPSLHLITFRPAATASLSSAYNKVPLRIDDSRPVIRSTIFLENNAGELCDLMLDTGSTLGLLVKTTDIKRLPATRKRKIFGRGFNGEISGVETEAKLLLQTIAISNVPAGITHAAWHSYASVGMEVMKNFSIVLNYCQSYAGFKKI